ncbi:MAG: TlpA family protein disulfide reductase [Candidatus Omnitrophica bacterium]|nr:TlpA family protein disulfide reductase [Candidatus Omnitrophota bacterium]
MKKLHFLSIVILVSLLFFLSCGNGPASSEGRISIEEWESQEKAILFFWTTWCPYCREEIKKLNNFYEELIGERFAIYFVNVKDSKSKVESFKEKMNIVSPIILDTEGALARRYKIFGFPTYIFLREGVEVDRSNYLTIKYLNRLYER